MSMEMLNVLQLLELLGGFLFFAVLLPGLVFYKKVKHFSASARFLIYFTIGNFYIINLVQVLELAFISYQFHCECAGPCSVLSETVRLLRNRHALRSEGELLQESSLSPNGF